MDLPYDDHGSAYGSMWHQGFPTQKQVQIKDNTWTLRYCETCRIYRPPRASHCRQCDNCVGKYTLLLLLITLTNTTTKKLRIIIVSGSTIVSANATIDLSLYSSPPLHCFVFSLLHFRLFI